MGPVTLLDKLSLFRRQSDVDIQVQCRQELPVREGIKPARMIGAPAETVDAAHPRVAQGRKYCDLLAWQSTEMTFSSTIRWTESLSTDTFYRRPTRATRYTIDPPYTVTGCLPSSSANGGRVLAFDPLLQRVWGKIIDMRAVRAIESSLRRKLGYDVDIPAYVFTGPHVGHRIPTWDIRETTE